MCLIAWTPKIGMVMEWLKNVDHLATVQKMLSVSYPMMSVRSEESQPEMLDGLST